MTSAPSEAADGGQATTAFQEPEVAVNPVGVVESASVVHTGYNRRDYVTRRLLAGVDVLGVLLAIACAGLVSGRGGYGEFVLWGAAMLPVWLLVFKAYGLYDRHVKRVSHTALDDAPWLFHALVIGGLTMWLWYKLVPVRQLALIEIATFEVVAMVGILALRALARGLPGRILGPERVLVVGDHETGNLLSKLKAHPEYGLEPVGVLSHDESPGDSFLPPLGDLDDFDLEALVARYEVDRVVLSHTNLSEAEMLDLLRLCQRLQLKVNVLPQLFDVMGPSVEVDDVEGLTVLGINPPYLPRSSRLLKRSLDLVGASLLLLLTAPLMAVVAIAIKLDSPGPVFFRQERIGRRGRRFSVLKFRTMVADAEQRAEELIAHSKDAHWLLLEDDPRITRVGRLLRLSSLDELPQFWNVLKGEMSLVGPRPLPEAEDRKIEGWGRGRLDLTPGISGPWQVLGRTSIPFKEMVKLDYLYVTNWSLWTDIRLLLRTLPAVLKRRGAN